MYKKCDNCGNEKNFEWIGSYEKFNKDWVHKYICKDCKHEIKVLQETEKESESEWEIHDGGWVRK